MDRARQTRIVFVQTAFKLETLIERFNTVRCKRKQMHTGELFHLTKKLFQPFSIKSKIDKEMLHIYYILVTLSLCKLFYFLNNFKTKFGLSRRALYVNKHGGFPCLNFA